MPQRSNLFQKVVRVLHQEIAGEATVDLIGWQIADKAKEKCAVLAGALATGATLKVPVAEPCALSNNGGIVPLLDASGTRVSGVSYTRERPREQGWTETF